MGRNKLIYALSALTLVVATSEGSSGTWAGAAEALRAKNGVVAVWRGPGEGSGNGTIEQQGAVSVSDISELGNLKPSHPDPSVEQLSLY